MRKAYIVQEPDEGSGMVIYASSDIEARKQGAIELRFDEEIRGMRCRRCADLDDKENDGRAQVRYLLALGWDWFLEDGSRVSEEDTPFITRGGGVWRSWMEWLDFKVERAGRKRKMREAESRVRGLWPWAEDIRVHLEPSGLIDATLRLPYLQDEVRYREKSGTCYVRRRDVTVFRQAYSINQDGRPADA